MATLYVCLQKHFNPWNTPDVMALILTLKAKIPDDDQLTVIPLGGAKQGYYKVILGEAAPQAPLT